MKKQLGCIDVHGKFDSVTVILWIIKLEGHSNVVYLRVCVK